MGLFLSVAPVLFSSFATYYVIGHEKAITQFTVWQWVLATVVCTLTSAFALTPPTLLALVAGYFLGWWALIPLLFLNLMAILLIVLLVRWVDQDRFLAVLEQNPKVGTVLERIRGQELKVIFFTKLSPVLPFALTNLVFALSGARLKNILFGGSSGMLLRTALAVWTGFQAREIRTLLSNPNSGSWTQIAIGGLLLISVAGLFLVLKRAVVDNPR